MFQDLIELLKKKNPDWNIEGCRVSKDGPYGEFGAQDRIKFNTNCELQYKVGSSWYFPNNRGVNLITFGRRFSTEDTYLTKPVRLVDQTSDPKVIEKWISWCVREGYSEEMMVLCNRIRYRLREVFSKLCQPISRGDITIPESCEFKIILPGTQYSIMDEEDNITNYRIFEITLPHFSDQGVKESFIIKINDKDNNYLWAWRKMILEDRYSDKPKFVISSISEEHSVRTINGLKEPVEKWVNEEKKIRGIN